MTLLLWSPAHAQTASTVDVYNNYYSPVEIHVVAGGTVTWTNRGGAHSVTSDDGTFDSNPSCIAGINCLANGDEFVVQFSTVGSFTYHCRVHGSAMVGKVVVDPVDTTTTTTSSTTSTTSSSSSGSTSSSDPSSSSASDAPTFVTQGSLPSLPPTTHLAALPSAIARGPSNDDLRPWVFADVGIAGATIIAGVVLVRRGRVPFG
jgi:plastocyanin